MNVHKFLCIFESFYLLFMQHHYTYQTYLINMDRAKDRLQMMKVEFEKTGMNYERIQAVDAKELKGDEYLMRNQYDRNLVPGEIGCYLSHVKTMENFLKSDYDYAFIVEDDAILPENLKQIIEESLSQYKELEEKYRWDVLKLNSRRRYIKIKDVKNTNHFIGVCGTSIPITTIAAVWTRNAAEKFLSKTFVNNKVIIKRPIDCELQHPWEYDLMILNLLPSLIKGVPGISQIQHDPTLRKAKLFRQIIYELKRIIPKYNYYISNFGFKAFWESFVMKKTPKI